MRTSHGRKKMNVKRDTNIMILLGRLGIKQAVLRKFHIKSSGCIYYFDNNLRSVFENYMSNTENFLSTVIFPFFSSYNLLITIVFTFLFNGRFKFHQQDNATFFNFSCLKKYQVALAQFITGTFMSLCPAVPCIILLMTLTSVGVDLSRNMFFPLLSTFFTHQVIASVIVLSQFLFRKKFISLFNAILAVTISSLLFELGKITPNFFVANLLERLSFTMRLQDIFVGAIKISDLIYFLSFPLTVTLVLKYFFQQQFVGEHKIQLKNTFGSLVLF